MFALRQLKKKFSTIIWKCASFNGDVCFRGSIRLIQQHWSIVLHHQITVIVKLLIILSKTLPQTLPQSLPQTFCIHPFMNSTLIGEEAPDVSAIVWILHWVVCSALPCSTLEYSSFGYSVSSCVFLHRGVQYWSILPLSVLHLGILYRRIFLHWGILQWIVLFFSHSSINSFAVTGDA